MKKQKADSFAVQERLLCIGLSEGQARLRRFSLRVREGRPQRPTDMIALADAFDAILKRADPKKALGISGKRYAGKPPRTAGEWGKEFSLGFEVEQLRRAEGLTVSQALDRLSPKCEKQGITRERLEKYRKRNLKMIVEILGVDAKGKGRS